MHTVDGPSDYQLVLFLESQEDGIYTIRVAFGRKGRCEMKLFEIPMVVTSLLGLCFLSGLDTRTAQAAFTFGKAENLGRPLNSAEREDWPVLSPDGLELYFMSERPGGYGRWDIWRSQRAGLEDSWGPPVNLGSGINDGGDNVATSISSDGLTFYLFATTGTFADLYTATRPTKDAPWGPRVNMGPVLNRPDEGDWVTMWGNDATPVISPDGLELFFSSWRPDAIGAADIYVSKRATLADPWGPPENLGPTINTPDDDGPAAISPDGLVLFIGSENRPGGFGNWDTWMIRRPYKGAPWSKPVNLGPSFNTPYGEILTGLSPDGQWAYFSDFCWSGEARRPGGYGGGDLWMAPIIPTVDFNADGKIDVVDLVMLINDWGTNKTLCDIGPMPWGDGKVDTADLKVFMTYFEKENSPAQGAGTMFPDFIATEGSAEGVAVDETGNVYVTVRAASDQVWKFSPSGEKSILADLGAPGGGAVGLALDAAGNVYACRALTGSGVYRIAPDGQTVRLPGTEQIVFPNALVFDDQETLYITETVSGDVAAKSFAPGGIWRLKKGGAAELWLRHELLTGLAPSFFPYPVGANGIVLYQGNLYVANTDQAHIVRIPVRPDGSAGQPEVWKKVEDVPESSLYNAPAFPLMLDGLALDAQGNIYVAVPSRNAIVRIEAHNRSQKTVAVHPQVPLDAPVSLAFGTDKSGSESLFITNLGMCAALIPNQTWPGPGLVKTNVPGPEGSN